jgi:hypothetical protein
MGPNSPDTRHEARLLVEAYIEAMVGVCALRLPTVADAVRKHAPEICVESSYEGEHVNLHAAEVVAGLALTGPSILATIDQISAAFASAMWELLKSHAHYDHIAAEPDIQFLRHLRNSCAHGGRWHFEKLLHPAKWRDKELRLEHAGVPAFGGMIKHGDLLLLLVDIDRKYFQQ